MKLTIGMFLVPLLAAALLVLPAPVSATNYSEAGVGNLTGSAQLRLGSAGVAAGANP